MAGPPPPDDRTPPRPDIWMPGSRSVPPPRAWRKGEPIPLVPHTFGSAFSATFALVRLYWPMIATIAAVFWIPFEFLEAFATRGIEQAVRTGTVEVRAEQVWKSGLVGIVGVIVALLVGPLVTGALIRAVARAHLGQPISLRTAIEEAWPFFGSILLVLLLTFVVVVGGLILLVIPGLVFLVRFSLAQPVLLVEGMRGREGLRRSWRLVKGRSWWVFGLPYVVGLVAALPTLIATVPLTLAARNASADSAWILRGIASSVGVVVQQVFSATAIMVVYFDRRVRNDMLDHPRLATELERSDRRRR